MISAKIDGADLKSMGLLLLEGSLDGFFKYPKRKSVNYNDWAESDGIEADLTEFKAESRSFTISLAYRGSDFMGVYSSLLQKLSAPGYRTIEICGVSRSVRLDVSSSLKLPYSIKGGVGTCSFTFVEDDPQPEEAEPYCGKFIPSVFCVAGYDMMEFGIGSEDPGDDLLKAPRLKDPFTDGNEYDLSEIKSRHKETRLNLWMVADSPDEFVNNWRAFYSKWAVPGLVDLYVTRAGRSVQAYYTDCSSFQIVAFGDRGVGANLSISIVIPQCDWLSMGGTSVERGLYAPELDSLLTDEEGNVLII